MTSPRLQPPFWRQDAYTLRQLAAAVTGVAAELINQPPGARNAIKIVDFGAGESPYRTLFQRDGVTYISSDIDAPLDGDTIRIVPGLPLPIDDDSVDLVLSFQVLEHVWDLDWYLFEARRLLARRGRLVISTHGVWPYHPHPTDFRRWTRDGLVAELEQRGFEAESVHALVGPLAYSTQVRALGWHRVLSRVPIVGGALAGLSSSIHHLKMLLEDAVTPQPWIDFNAAIYLVIARPVDPESSCHHA
jgi:SAM-dependent methyltransferase